VLSIRQKTILVSAHKNASAQSDRILHTYRNRPQPRKLFKSQLGYNRQASRNYFRMLFKLGKLMLKWRSWNTISFYSEAQKNILDPGPLNVRDPVGYHDESKRCRHLPRHGPRVYLVAFTTRASIYWYWMVR
jgi:hypothetical protein